MKPKPLKRDKALQQLSREHHHGLLLSWKIRTGLNKNISLERIQVYVLWFYENHLIPHFEMEETHVFPILGSAHELIKRAIDDHKKLKYLFAEKIDTRILTEIEETLDNHIRFEERILFPEIQKVATKEQLKLIETLHDDTLFIDKLDDEFWK